MRKLLLFLALLPFSNQQLAWSSTILADGATIPVPPPGPGVRRIDKHSVGAGDILIDTRVRTKAAVQNLWPDGVLPYAFEASVTADQKAAFVQACQTWTSATPVSCRARTTEADYVLVRTHSGDACGAVTSCSYVGRIGGAQHFSVLTTHWAIPEVIQHELGHAFGLVHEQVRPDRDTYIFVRTQNIKPEYYHDIADTSGARPVSDYDYVSIMHYSNCAASVHGDCSMNTRDYWTLEPKSCGLDLVGGHTISQLDKDGLRQAYAPSIAKLFGSKRDKVCGTLTYATEVVGAGCSGGSCAGAASQESFNKVEHPSMGTCGGFVPIGWGEGQCVPLHKTEMSLNYHSASFACGFLHLQTQNYAEATCGCPVSNIAAQCTFASDGTLTKYETAAIAGSWRAGRVQYFQEVMVELNASGALAPAVIEKLRDFYFANGADRRFETRLFRLRSRFYSYARWHKTVNASFVADEAAFARFAHREGLRAPETI